MAIWKKTLLWATIHFLPDLDRDSLLFSSERVARETAGFKWLGIGSLVAFCTVLLPDSLLLQEI